MLYAKLWCFIVVSGLHGYSNTNSTAFSLWSMLVKIHFFTTVMHTNIMVAHCCMALFLLHYLHCHSLLSPMCMSCFFILYFSDVFIHLLPSIIFYVNNYYLCYLFLMGLFCAYILCYACFHVSFFYSLVCL